MGAELGLKTDAQQSKSLTHNTCFPWPLSNSAHFLSFHFSLPSSLSLSAASITPSPIFPKEQIPSLTKVC